MGDNILVSICSLTYNHAPYIRQCLDGMLMQKTNFDFEIIINDDCSTDGTTDIIREYAEKYPDIIKPIYHEENQYQKGVRGMFNKFVFPKAQGKYIALCEGDDYWTDPLKLQKQVDILEKYNDVVMVYTAFQTIDGKGEKIYLETYENLMKYSASGDIFYKLLKTNFILTLTTCFRNTVTNLDVYSQCPMLLDWSLFLAVSSDGKAYYIPEKTGCYRKHSMGATNTWLKKINFTNKIKFHYFKCYLNGSIKKRPFLSNLKILNLIVYTLYFNKSNSFDEEELKYKKDFSSFKILYFIIPITFLYSCLKNIKKRFSSRENTKK